MFIIFYLQCYFLTFYLYTDIYVVFMIRSYKARSGRLPLDKNTTKDIKYGLRDKKTFNKSKGLCIFAERLMC